MPVRSYECLYLLDANKAETEFEAIRTQLHASLEKYGAEVLAARRWDNRKLAYAINGQKKGVYYLAFFKMDSLKVHELDGDYRLNENILRHCVSAVDPKWEEEMLAVAREEGRMAVQLIHEEGSSDSSGLPGQPAPAGGEGGPGGDDGEGRPRRFRRPMEAGVE